MVHQNSAAKPLNFTGNLTGVKTSIFTQMAALAQQEGAYNLSQGFPDFPADPALIDRVSHYLRADENQYAPMAGIPSLRKAIIKFSEELYGSSYNPDTEITITAGATQAISTAIATSIKEGDEVLLFSPAYDCYIPQIKLHGGTPITVKLTHPEYHVDWDQVKHLVNHRTKMIILNTPHNPSGSMWAEGDFQNLNEIVRNSNILILGDEVYEHLTYGSYPHLSLRNFPELRKRSFVVGSMGKSLRVTGWKIGYILAPENLMREFQKVHQYQIFCVNKPIQLAIADYLATLDFAEIGTIYGKKQKRFEELLSRTAFEPLPVQGGYFQLADYSKVSLERDGDFVNRLARDYKVAAIPLSPFYRHPTDERKVIRFCFAKNDETLEAAIAKLAEVPVLED